MAPTNPRVLVLGGHGKISLFLQPLLLAKKWNVISVIRNREQEAEILALGKDKPGTIDVLVDSLDDVKETSQAQRVLDKVKPDYVVWSAGEFVMTVIVEIYLTRFKVPVERVGLPGPRLLTKSPRRLTYQLR